MSVKSTTSRTSIGDIHVSVGHVEPGGTAREHLSTGVAESGGIGDAGVRGDAGVVDEPLTVPRCRRGPGRTPRVEDSASGRATADAVVVLDRVDRDRHGLARRGADGSGGQHPVVEPSTIPRMNDLWRRLDRDRQAPGSFRCPSATGRSQPGPATRRSLWRHADPVVIRPAPSRVISSAVSSLISDLGELLGR